MSDLQLLLLTRTTCHAGHRYPDCAGEQAECPQGTPHRSVASRTDPESRALSLGGFSRTTTRDLQLGVKHPKEQRGPAAYRRRARRARTSSPRGFRANLWEVTGTRTATPIASNPRARGQRWPGHMRSCSNPLIIIIIIGIIIIVMKAMAIMTDLQTLTIFCLFYVLSSQDIKVTCKY